MNTRTFFTAASFAMGIVLAIASSSFGGLIEDDSSHIKLLADGRHMLVLLVPNPAPGSDELATLPNGHTVPLRKTFPASGCYEIDSTTPLWTAPYEDYECWIVSNDCRYLIRCSCIGPGQYWKAPLGSPIWGLKFYDRGREVKSYDFRELVDFPSLMPMSDISNFGCQWVGDQWWDEVYDNLTIRDGRFHLETSTHESYVFDLATGEIVKEHRLWRNVIYGLSATSLVAVVSIAAFANRLYRRAPLVSPADRLAPKPAAERRRTNRIRFDLRSLLFATAAVAVLSWAVPRWPHIAAYLVSFLITALMTRSAIRALLPNGQIGLSRSYVAKFGLCSAAIIAWICFYFLSIGPINFLLNRFDAPGDVRWALRLTIYRPCLWLPWQRPDDLWSPLA